MEGGYAGFLLLLSQVITIYWLKTIQMRDFPGISVIKNQPANAGDMGLIPGQVTKIPHAMGQLSPHTTTRESPMT